KSPKQAATLPLCAQDGNTETYLNRQDVRTALHIPSTVPHWTDCANINYDSQYDNMITQFQTLLQKKVQILVYNGDVDSVCNIIMNASSKSCPQYHVVYQQEVDQSHVSQHRAYAFR
uniref:Uncharacterized protein n=1 Tax=Acrobeloides nanus TaxID=290746 RepID=A0A914D889_9BILA